MIERIFWKIIPWDADIKNKRTMELIDSLNDEGYRVEIEYYNDRDNGRMPILFIWGQAKRLKE